MAKIIIETPIEGLAPKYWQGVNLIKIATDRMYAGGVLNPLNYLGFISPASNTFTTFTNYALVDSGVEKFIAVDDNNTAVGYSSIYLLAGSKVHALNNETDTIINAAEFPHTVNASAGVHTDHTGEILLDCVFYQVNGVQKLCYFYKDATDGDMGTYDLISSFTTNNANEAVWSSASGGAVLGASDIIAEVADNNFLYVAQDYALHKFDGTTNGGSGGTVTANLLTLGANRQITHLKDGLGKMWIATDEKQIWSLANDRNIQIAVWDRLSTSLSFEDVIPISGVSKIDALFFWKGIPHLITSSLEDVIVVQLRAWNGREFTVIAEIGGYDVQPDNRNAVFNLGNGIAWLAGNGGIYYYGSLAKGLPEGIFKIGAISSTTGTSSSFKLSSNKIALSYYTPSSWKTSSWNLNGGSAVNQGDIYTKVYELPKLSKITGMTVYYLTPGDATDKNVTIKFYKNFSSSAISGTSFTINYRTIANKGDGDRGYKYFPLGGSNFENTNAFQLEIEYPTGTSLTNALRISRIEVEYEPTEKKK